MIRAAAIGLGVLAVATPAIAQPRPARAPAFNGVALGTTLAAARAKLGPTFKLGGVGEPFQDLSGVGYINGQAYDLSYVFRKSNRLTDVYAKWYSPKVDNASCSAHYTTVLAALVGQVGKPHEIDERLQDPQPQADAEWRFQDGSDLDLMLRVYRDRCILEMSAGTKDGQTSD